MGHTVLFWLGLLVWGLAGAASPVRGVAVLYPEVGEPYRAVFGKMIEGIESQQKGPVLAVPVGNNPNVGEVAGELRRNDVRVVIALGRNGLKVIPQIERELGRDLEVVVGGVVSVPEAELRHYTVYSLAPDPALLFARLHSLLPTVRRIFVVYDPAQNAWLIRQAKVAASARGIDLVAHEASDLRAAIQHYQSVVATMESGKDALWLPIDATTVQDATVIPMVLQEAWNRNLAVFSGNVAHVRRGVLFALYPNNLEIGRHLAEYAQGSRGRGGILPLRAVQFAVNVRTASHLGVDVSPRRANFDLVFPEQ